MVLDNIPGLPLDVEGDVVSDGWDGSPLVVAVPVDVPVPDPPPSPKLLSGGWESLGSQESVYSTPNEHPASLPGVFVPDDPLCQDRSRL